MRTCDLCERKHYARGLCQRHYMRWWTNDTGVYTDVMDFTARCAPCHRRLDIAGAI